MPGPGVIRSPNSSRQRFDGLLQQDPFRRATSSCTSATRATLPTRSTTSPSRSVAVLASGAAHVSLIEPLSRRCDPRRARWAVAVDRRAQRPARRGFIDRPGITETLAAEQDAAKVREHFQIATYEDTARCWTRTSAVMGRDFVGSASTSNPWFRIRVRATHGSSASTPATFVVRVRHNSIDDWDLQIVRSAWWVPGDKHITDSPGERWRVVCVPVDVCTHATHGRHRPRDRPAIRGVGAERNALCSIAPCKRDTMTGRSRARDQTETERRAIVDAVGHSGPWLDGGHHSRSPASSWAVAVPSTATALQATGANQPSAPSAFASLKNCSARASTGRRTSWSRHRDRPRDVHVRDRDQDGDAQNPRGSFGRAHGDDWRRSARGASTPKRRGCTATGR